MSDLIFDEATSLRLPEPHTTGHYVWDPDGERHDLHHEKLGDLLDTHGVVYQTPPTTRRYKIGDILETATDFDNVPIGTIIVGLREWEYRKVLSDAWNTSENFAGICLNRQFVENDLNWKYPGPGHWEIIYLPATYTGKERESFLRSYPTGKETEA